MDFITLWLGSLIWIVSISSEVLPAKLQDYLTLALKKERLHEDNAPKLRLVASGHCLKFKKNIHKEHFSVD